MKYLEYKNLYISLRLRNNINLDIEQYKMDFLDDKDSVSFSKTDKLRKKENSLYIRVRELKKFLNCEKIEKSLNDYKYKIFSYELSNHIRVSKELDRDYMPFLNHLLVILLNTIQINLPTIWISYQSGYCDIRYFFDILYYGGRIHTSQVNIPFSKVIWNFYYYKIINNIKNTKWETVMNLNRLYPSETTLSILSSNFTPYPKNKYNSDFVNIKNN